MKTMKLKTKVVFALMAFGLLITGGTENESTEPVIFRDGCYVSFFRRFYY